VKTWTAGLVSVVLVNFRGADDTIEAIRLLQQLDWPRELLEIVVVENGSGDDSLERLRATEGIVLVPSTENLGFTGGCNLGVSRASGEFVAFLNNDARPDAKWISAAIDTFNSGQDVAAVASKVLDWDGERIDFVDSSLTWYGMGYKPHAGEVDRGSWDEEHDVLFGTGAAMFVRHEVFDELGGFDDEFFMFYDDVDLGWRLNLLGYRFRYQPKSVAYHKHHASMNKFGSFRELYLLERNALFTLYKNLDDESLEQVFAGSLLLTVRRAVGRGDLDSTSLDIRRPGDEAEDLVEIPKVTAAGLFAIDQFVEKLPEMDAARKRIQSTRRRPQRDIARLFGTIDQPAYPIDSYLRGYDKIVATLGVLVETPRSRVLVITGDPIGRKMAGPAIRAWNIAKQLAPEHDVRLVSMTKAVPLDDSFEVGVISHRRPSTIVQHEKWADIIIVQGNAIAMFPALAKTSKILVVDVYDPLHLEQLEQGRKLGLNLWNKQIIDSTAILNQQLQIGDFFVCANERQRHFWLGQLAALGRVNAFNYSRDNELESLIAIAPFGIDRIDPVVTHPAIRGVVPGIGKDDKVIIWGGGIYDWFDPDTLIRAVGQLALRHPEVRLFFMGTKHPNPDVPEMQALSRARTLADTLGLTGKNVFFNEQWVSFDERQNYLLEADVGVSTHFQHVETTFSFRTRILDYLWARLPIVTTEGDSFGDLVEREQLGVSIPERDGAALEAALEKLLFNKKAAAAARANVDRVRADFFWDHALRPIVEFCRRPMRAADKTVLREGKKDKSGPIKPVEVRRRSGVAHDLSRVRYYLREGGLSAVAERVSARAARRRETAE